MQDGPLEPYRQTGLQGLSAELSSCNHSCVSVALFYELDLKRHFIQTALDEAVDLYSMWIDACEAVNVQEDAPAPRRQAQSSSRRAARGSDDEDEDEDDEPAPSRRTAARGPDLDDDDDDEELPDLPGTRPAASKSNGNSRSGAAGNDDADEGDDQDADASIDRSAPVDMGYERQPVNAKMAALLEQRKGRAAQVADDSDEDE